MLETAVVEQQVLARFARPSGALRTARSVVSGSAVTYRIPILLGGSLVTKNREKSVAVAI